jgi:H+/Cl- antiporter ClcA
VRGALRMARARARGMTMAVAAVVGIFTGIAAGLFAHAIRFVQILFFRGNEVLADLFGVGRRDWAAQFYAEPRARALALRIRGLSALGLTFVLDWLRPRLPARFSRLEASRVRAIVIAGSFGLALYYPLLLLATFSETFQIREGGMVALALAAPLWMRLFAPVIGAIAASLLVRYVSLESGGHGGVEVIEAVHSKKPLRGRVTVWKSLAAGLVIGLGGSAGRDGTVVHLGGAVASRWCRVSDFPAATPVSSSRAVRAPESRPPSMRHSRAPCSRSRPCSAAPSARMAQAGDEQRTRLTSGRRRLWPRDRSLDPPRGASCAARSRPLRDSHRARSDAAERHHLRPR